VSQTGKAPFNPRDAVEKFVPILREYNLTRVSGDAYAGQTFRRDFQEHGITYRVGAWKSAHDIFEAAEPLINAGKVSWSTCRSSRSRRSAWWSAARRPVTRRSRLLQASTTTGRMLPWPPCSWRRSGSAWIAG
jgi:hypothetical protein